MLSTSFHGSTWMTGNSSSVSRSSELHETEEQPLNVNKPHLVSGIVNRKRPFPVGSSSSHMAQWVGQRSQKITRTRRANVMSPVLSCDEVHTSLERSSPSHVGTKMTSTTADGLHNSSGAINSGIQPGIMKHEHVSSPTRLSGSEVSYKDELPKFENYSGSDDHPAHQFLLNPSNYSSIESELIFVGLVGLRDPLGRKYTKQLKTAERLESTRTPAFGASSIPSFGASNTPTFGAASTPAFGATSSPAFGVTSTLHLVPPLAQLLVARGVHLGCQVLPYLVLGEPLGLQVTPCLVHQARLHLVVQALHLVL